MRLPTVCSLSLSCLLMLVVTATLSAIETENIGLQVPPAPGKVTIDGLANDWDRSGGVFACSDVESLRDSLGVWFHAMYDAGGLYFLARWNDETPLNNPGQTAADYGFAGDCLQMRFITSPGKPNERGGHFTCWRGIDGKDLIFFERGKTFNEGSIKDALLDGAKQAMHVDDDRHYTQEIFIPWKHLTRHEKPLAAGDVLRLAIEPNFTIGKRGRLSVKDIFQPGISLDRVFTFMSHNQWGSARLEPKGNLPPRPVRLSDGREFPVTITDGKQVVDWSGLVKSRELLGFKNIEFEMPQDGFVSINILDAAGTVVRQLTSAAFYSKGKHTVRWDGLTTPSWTLPGIPVAAGDYAWTGIYHGGIGLRLRGWACNGGSAPWDGPSGKDNWGGDHGVPTSCAADKDQVYLCWSGAEAGKAVLALDKQGNIAWTNIRGGIAGAMDLANDNGTLYVLGGLAGPASEGASMYKLDAKNGSYQTWDDQGTVDLEMAKLPALASSKEKSPVKADGIDAYAGKVYLSFASANTIVVIDGKSGRTIKTLTVPAPRHLQVAGGNVLYVVSGGKEVLAVDLESGTSKPFVGGLENATGITVDSQRNVYVGVRSPANQVLVFDPAGKPLRKIGRAGGRALTGAWTNDGLQFIGGIAIDADDRLWAAEVDSAPKRMSVWNSKTGELVRELFGATAYGALGGNICPLNPNLMVGQGCEWLLDSKTGRANCLGVITREGMENARFAQGSNDKLYLAVAGNWAFNSGPLTIYERVSGSQTSWGDYRLRTVIFQQDDKGREIGVTGHGSNGGAKKTFVWSDENGDGQRQPTEISGVDGDLRFSGWYMNMTPDLTLYSGDNQFRVSGFTPCGAPRYDLSKPVKMPAPGLGSADGKVVLQGGEYGVDHGQFRCFDIASKQLKWTYPDNFVGVHGSHNAPPPETGLIRGGFNACGAVKLPEPIGNLWAIPTNVGEWHLLTGDGYYLTRLFQPDPLKVVWPESAVPGAVMNNAPCGMGGEDFGGSMTLGNDGKLYVQAGKTGFWNLEVTGLDGVRALPGSGRLSITSDEVVEAGKLREEYLQARVGVKKLAVKHLTPTFTGSPDTDFAGAQFVTFKKQDDATVRAAVAWDDMNLYAMWDVSDATPWVNGADSPEFMYARGDTVDLQLGVNPAANPERTEPVEGDLRLSVGNFKSTPTAVLYRKVSAQKNPKRFSSGVIKDYEFDSVTAIESAKIKVQKRDKGYIVEAAIPLAALGLKPTIGLTLSGDLGVTHSSPSGDDTALRTYWSNQKTGLVNDEVFELMIEPKNWGRFVFEGN